MKVLVIGRSQNNDIVISDPYVSRTHAQLIIHDNGTASIVDLNSKTGTYVNGLKINSEHVLNNNDVVKIGNSILPWQNYLTQDTSAQPQSQNQLEEEGYYEEEDYYQEPKGFFAKYKKALLIGLLSLLLIGGGVYYYLNYYKKDNSSEQEQKAENQNNKDEAENKENIIEVGDFQVTLPDGFEENDSDDDVYAHYKKGKMDLYIYETDIADFKKKNKKVKKNALLKKFKDQTLSKLKKNKVIKEVENDEEQEINGINAYVVDLKLKKNSSFAKRAFYQGDDNFYEIYIITKEKSKKKKDENISEMEDIIFSFANKSDDNTGEEENEDNANNEEE